MIWLERRGLVQFYMYGRQLGRGSVVLYSRKSRKYWTFGNMASVCEVLFPKVTKILDFWELGWCLWGSIPESHENIGLLGIGLFLTV